MASAPPRSIVTSHAISRYRERVAPISADAAVEAMDTPRIRAMIAFGAREIRLGGGQKLVIAGGLIVTVRPKAFGKCRSGKPLWQGVA